MHTPVCCFLAAASIFWTAPLSASLGKPRPVFISYLSSKTITNETALSCEQLGDSLYRKKLQQERAGSNGLGEDMYVEIELPPFSFAFDSLLFYEHFLNELGKNMPAASISEQNEPGEAMQNSNLQIISRKRNDFAELYYRTDRTGKIPLLEAVDLFLWKNLLEQILPPMEGKSPPNMPITYQHDKKDYTVNRSLIVSALRSLGFIFDSDDVYNSSSRNVIKAISSEGIVRHCTGFDELKKYLVQKGVGLYVVSFDQYLAFLQHNGTDIWLIQADPLAEGIITKTHLYDALAFQKFVPNYNVGTISGNLDLIRNWLTMQKISLK